MFLPSQREKFQGDEMTHYQMILVVWLTTSSFKGPNPHSLRLLLEELRAVF
jgi:hypothetical protein